MQIARGTFTGRGSNFNGQFDAEGFQVIMAGRFSQSLLPFNVPKASITYRSLVDFSGTFTIGFSTPPSFVGKDTVDITFRRQGDIVLHLTGRLASPTDRRQIVTGSAQWPQH